MPYRNGKVINILYINQGIHFKMLEALTCDKYRSMIWHFPAALYKTCSSVTGLFGEGDEPSGFIITEKIS